jgi:uncharacterized protein YuzE
MNKYKLIKEYPGSPKLGFIYDPETIASKEYGQSAHILSSYPSIVTGNQEFWEEIIEKDYEILVLKHKENKCFYTKIIDFRNLDKYDIHSVKRLSDGEMFTVGDDCITEINNYGVIALFEIFNNKLYIKSNGNKHSTYTCEIKDLLKIKKLLGTTTEGDSIYEGDNLWCVKEGRVKQIFACSFSEEHVRYFSTQKAADDVVCEERLLDKKVLSINNIMKVWKYNKSAHENQQALIKFIKNE